MASTVEKRLLELEKKVEGLLNKAETPKKETTKTTKKGK